MAGTDCEIDDVHVSKSPAVPAPPVKFQIRLLDYQGKAMANRNCTLDWNKLNLKAVSDGDGVVQFSVPAPRPNQPMTLSGTLHVEAFPSAPTLDINVVMLSALKPADTAEGAKVRLANLGYREDLNSTSSQFGASDTRALQRFRFANKIYDPKTLLPTGPETPPVDPATKARLEQAHDTRGPLLAP